MDLLNSVLNILADCVKIAGLIFIGWGGVQVGIGVHDHTGPSIQNGIWWAVGGAVIIASGTLFASIVDVDSETAGMAIQMGTTLLKTLAVVRGG